MNYKQFKKLEIVGIFFIFILTSILHFIYEWTDQSIIGILFGAVNESVWEHIKIFTISYVVWSIIELLALKPSFKQFVVSKVTGLVFLGLIIPLFFYFYTFFTKKPILFIDIGASIVWVVLSQFISYRLLTSSRSIRSYFPVAVLTLCLYFVMFFSFTVFPPKAELFRDNTNGMYGIIPQYIDAGAFLLDRV